MQKVAFSICRISATSLPRERTEVGLTCNLLLAIKKMSFEGKMETVQDRVLRVIATTCRKPLDTVHADSTFEALGIDSLDRLNILFELEGEFDLQIDDEEAKSVTNVQEMVQGIELLLRAKADRTASPAS